MSPTLLMIIAVSLACFGTVLGLRDKSLILTAALPNGAAATTTNAIDLESGPASDFLANVEFELSVPALTTGQLADTQTITYTVETSATSDFGSTTLLMSLQTVTGAGGAGASALTRRFKLPTNVQRYVRIKATKAGASNASTASMTFALLQVG